ncbi:MAG: flippase-like domain-containing protein [Chloroflexi bacterium]|nr:MAG: flippase-like domain-containing protein [Chloroflexota bacterium]
MKHRWLRVAMPVVVTIVLLFVLLRAVRPAELAETLADVSPGLALLAAVAAFGFIAARSFRYRLLLGNGRPRRMRTILAVTLSSWGASLILPGPSGDAAFVMLARTRLTAPVAVGVGAALLSRLLDVASLLLVALITAPLAGVVLPGAMLGGGVVLALLIAVGLTALFWSRPRGAIVGWLERLSLPASLHERLHFAIEELGSGSRPALLVAATVAARVATGLQYFALFAAIDQPLSLVQVWFALSIRTLLLAVPIQGVVGLGTMQVWWTAALTLLGWPVGDAIAASLAVHLLDLCVSLPQAALGWLTLTVSATEQPRSGVAQRR